MPICPWCKNRSSLSKENEVLPRSGDLSLCTTCFSWSIYTDDQQLRWPTSKEGENIRMNSNCTRIRTRVMLGDV